MKTPQTDAAYLLAGSDGPDRIDALMKLAEKLELENQSLSQKADSKEYKFRQFKDGWWSVVFYSSLQNWGKWRGPFDTKADAEIDCAQASRGKYSL